MKYLVKAIDKPIYAKSELEFTLDYNKAKKYNTIGDAMKLASIINEEFGAIICKFCSL